MKLTPKQRKFADNYIKTGNATESAIKAGYSENTARAIGAENLTKPNIKKYVEQRLTKQSDNTIASAEEILQYLTKVVRAEIKEKSYKYVDGELEEMEYDPDIRDRTKAAELLGKRYGVFIDRLEANISVKGLEDFFGDSE